MMCGLITTLLVAFLIGLSRKEVFGLAIFMGLPGAWMMDCKDWVVRIIDYGDDWVRLSFKRPQYATEFSRLNAAPWEVR